MVALRIRPPTVLVVEDDALLRMVATDLVEDLGFAVFEVASADAAVTTLEEHEEITIIFTDIQMAGSIDGLELADLARVRWPAIGLVVVSGRHVPDIARMPTGSRFFTKPYSPAVLRTALVEMSDAITAAATPPSAAAP